jgi:hypothetical protein
MQWRRKRELPESFDPPLDPGIAYAVEILYILGVDTFDSCEGGEGHLHSEPIVRFHGDFPSAGYQALSIALAYYLPVRELRRRWSLNGGEIARPDWEIVFSPEIRHISRENSHTINR